MNLDLIIVYMLLNIEYYNKYNMYIDYNSYKINNREIYRILYTIKKMRQDREDDISIDDLVLTFNSLSGNLKEEEKQAYGILFDRLREVKITDTAAEDYFRGYLEKKKAQDIAVLAIEVVDGKKQFSELQESFADFPTESILDEVQFVTDDLHELYSTTRHLQGLRWPLDCLNKSLGSLRGGDFGFILARPEAGKSTWCAHVATYMTEQHDGNTLWCNNEERGSKVKVRNFQALFGKTSEELFGDIQYFNNEWANRIGNRLRLYDDATITAAKIEQLAKELKPKLIVIDQIDKVKGIAGEGHSMLKELYQWGRELAKKHNCPVIAVSQASAPKGGSGGASKEKFYLDMNDIDGSKTGKPGEADWILGIGLDEDNPGIRGFSVIKNKLTGDDDSSEQLRHMKKPVRIFPEIARYGEMN